MNIVQADGLVMSAEQFWNLILITLPTVALAIATIWANDRLAHMVVTALLSLAPKSKKRKRGTKTTETTVPPVVNVLSVEVHGRHEAPEGEERHGFTFNAANRLEENWDKALEDMTKGNLPKVWPEHPHN